MTKLKAVYYINQFYTDIDGEDKADAGKGINMFKSLLRV